MTSTDIRVRALQMSFTRVIEVEAAADDLTLWVRPHTDLDGEFEGICNDTGERLRGRAGTSSFWP